MSYKFHFQYKYSAIYYNSLGNRLIRSYDTIKELIDCYVVNKEHYIHVNFRRNF